MKDQKHDRRSQRTRQMLNEALVDLMLTRRYDDITVQDILDRANVGRSTFYTHFYDKDDLLVSSFEAVLARLSEHLQSAPDRGDVLIPSLALFQHVGEYRYLYNALVSSKRIDMVMSAGQVFLSRDIERRLRDRIGGDRALAVPLAALTTYLAGSLVVLLRWWLDTDQPYSAAQVDAMFRALVQPGLDALIRDAAIDR